MYQRRGHFTYLRFFFKSQRVCIVLFSSHSCTFLRTSDAFPPILYIITWHMWQRDRYFWYFLCIVTTHFDKLCILQYLSQLQFLKCVSTLHDLLLLGGGSIHKLEGEVVPSIFALFRGRFGNEGRLQWMVKYSYINRVV